MTSLNQDFTSYAGDDLKVVVTVRDNDGDVIDLSDVDEIVWKLADEFDAPVLSRSKTDGEVLFVTDGADGQIKISVSKEGAAVTAGLYGWYAHAAHVEDATGNISTFETGRILFGPNPRGAPAADATPDAFAFTDVTDATLDTVYTSDEITVAGIDAPVAVSIVGGSYSVNGALYTSLTGTATVGDTITVRGTSSDVNSTAVNVVLTVGGVSDTFTITTEAP